MIIIAIYNNFYLSWKNAFPSLNFGFVALTAGFMSGFFSVFSTYFYYSAAFFSA